MTRILIVRHGTNDALRAHRLIGRLPGVHLNAEGQAQAAALAERLATVDLAAIYASPMERAVETAQPLAERHGLTVQIHPGLHESDPGRWAGEPIEALRRRPLWRRLERYPSGTHFPGGESGWQVQQRMVAAVDGIAAAQPERTVAVFSHADPIKIALAYYLGMPLDLFRRLSIAPASLTILELGESTPRLVCLNDTSHLPPEPEQKGV